jgi:hypothetical protein
MAGDEVTEDLSAEFLAANRGRLDVIGAWEWDEGEDAILWREPDALRNDWVPFDLRFHAEAEGADGTFDPDDAMFALWKRYARLHAKAVRKFRREARETFADDDDAAFGKRAVTRACVWVRRGGESGDTYHALEVTFAVPADGDHGYYADFDEETGEFTEFSCA